MKQLKKRNLQKNFHKNNFEKSFFELRYALNRGIHDKFSRTVDVTKELEGW